jgi:hypothetical protein
MINLKKILVMFLIAGSTFTYALASIDQRGGRPPRDGEVVDEPKREPPSRDRERENDDKDRENQKEKKGKS